MAVGDHGSIRAVQPADLGSCSSAPSWPASTWAARDWGSIVAAMALGSVVAELALLGRRPRRPLVIAVIGSYGYPAPCLLLSLHLPVYGVALGACTAGVGSAMFGTYRTTVIQRQVPEEMLARVKAFALTGSYALGSAGFLVIGPVAGALGPGAILGVAAAHSVISSTVVLSLRAIRSLRLHGTRSAPSDPNGR
jgi:hypothetical protein